MTKIWLFGIYVFPFLSTVLTLAMLGGLWLLHRHITKCLNSVGKVLIGELWNRERSLRSHIVDEINQIQIHTTELAANTLGQLDRTESVIVNFVKTHADSLHRHAEDLRNHAKELTDRAEVTASAPRQAVTRN